MMRILISMLTLVIFSACPDGDDRPCRNDESCDPPEVCVFDGDDAQVGQCSDDFISGDAGPPPQQSDAGSPTDPPSNDAGSPGSPDVAVLPPRVAVKIAVGNAHACAILSSGEVSCWGSNNSNQTQNSATNFNELGPPAVVAELSEATLISAGNSHTCVKARGFSGVGIYCFGRQSEGQLGMPPASGEFVKAELPGVTAEDISALASVENTNYIALSNGDAFCFGQDCGGGLTLQAKPFLDGALRFDLGIHHTCSTNGTDMRCEEAPAAINANCTNFGQGVSCPGITDVTASSNASCYVGSPTECSGENEWGLSSPTQSASGLRTSNPGLGSVVAGSTQSFCTLAEQRIKCWGRNIFGSTGQSANFGSECAAAPTTLCHDIVDVPQTQGAVDLQYNSSEGCALLANGSVTCWGQFFGGQALAPTTYTFE